MGENNDPKVQKAQEIYFDEDLDNIQKTDQIDKELDGDFYNNGDTRLYEMDIITKQSKS